VIFFFFCFGRSFNILLQRQRQQPPLNDHEKRKFKDIVKRLEEGLLRAAHTKVF
jgi:hypothetical protein